MSDTRSSGNGNGNAEDRRGSNAPSVHVCVPWRENGGWRTRNWRWCRDWWLTNGFTVIEGSDGSNPFNRAAARNHAASKSNADVIVFADADTIGEPAQIHEAIRHAHATGELAYPHTQTGKLNSSESGRLKAGGEPRVSAIFDGSPGGILAVRRDVWQEYVWDEGFDGGWGYEDVAYMWMLETLVGVHRVEGWIYHLWHPVDQTKRAAITRSTGNRDRRDRYAAARGKPRKMKDLVEELYAIPA